MSHQQTIVSAPGKIILFGEHAVVYGEPALALAIDLRMTVRVRPSQDQHFWVNGQSIDEYRNRYVRKAVELFWDGPPLDIGTRSSIPNAAGLGSSAAITTAMVGALMTINDEYTEEQLARNAFAVESGVQGKSSPTDTSTSTHGSGIILTRDPLEDLLWSIHNTDNQWCVNNVDVPDLTIVLGHTRMGANTPQLVSMVRRFVESNSFAKDVIHDIGMLTRSGFECMKNGDKKRLGELMNRNHDLLAILGINTRRLQRMEDTVQPHSSGAKMTGAGGGGCIIALTDNPDETSDAILRYGGQPIVVKTTKQGFTVHESSFENP